MELTVTTAVLGEPFELEATCWKSVQVTSDLTQREWLVRYNSLQDNLGVTGSLQWLYEHTTAPLIAFFHSDLEIHEQSWDQRVLAEFADPSVGIVGFGGALQLGEDDLYRTPYRLTQLRRISYKSNMTDAETHGERFEGECDVATLDGFALVVRRQLLDQWRSDPVVHRNDWCGWDVERYPFHNYDNALCLQAAKQGYRVRLVGISCTHHGGLTSTTAEAQQYWQREGTSDADIHEQSHLYLYEDGRGYLPLKAKQ